MELTDEKNNDRISLIGNLIGNGSGDYVFN